MKHGLIILVAVFTFCMGSLASADEENGDNIVGVWFVKSAKVNGNQIDGFDGATLTLGKTVAIMVSYFPSGRQDIDENPYEIDTSTSPNRLTLFQMKQRESGMQCAIFKLEKGRLTICMNGPSTERKYPQSFDQSNCLLMTCKRQVKK